MASRPASMARAISDLDLVWLAAISMNSSPVHLDAALAARGPMGAPIVVGALTAAIAEGLASQVVPRDLGSPIGWERITLVAPVYVHDTIHVEIEVLKRDSRSPDEPTRVLVRAFTGSHKVVAELVTLFAAPTDSHG